MAYRSDLGNIWKRAKMWNGSNSGPLVHLMEFPAVVLAAHVRDHEELMTVVPVAASAFSQQCPGAMSLRLARRVSELARVPMRELIVKRGHRQWEFDGTPGEGGRVILIDDQITSGNAVTCCSKLLAEHGYTVEHAVAWSGTRIRDEPVPTQPGSPPCCWLAQTCNELPVTMKCPSDRH